MPKSNKEYAGNTWTKARYFAFIRSALRRAWQKYPVKWQVLGASASPNDGRFDSRTKKMYQCNVCKNWFKAKDVQVDHIKPAGTLKEYKDLPEFVSTLFCEEDNLQVICKECHDAKTKEERESRKP